MMELILTPYGPRAILLNLRNAGGGSDLGYVRRLALMQSLSARLERASVFVEVVPAYDELLVTWRPTAARANVEAFVREAYREICDSWAAAKPTAREHVIEVDYDGPDLAAVAKTCGLSFSEVIGLHTAGTYRVDAIGFQPGFAYLGGLAPALRLPRRSSPRVRVTPGSVAIAEGQTAVYPHASPGGWHLLGTTCASLLDETARKLSVFEVGDEVSFVQRDRG